MNIKEHISLLDYSTMKVGGNARYLIEIKDKSELRDAVAFARDNNIPMIFVGGGSNILFDDIGFHGLVLKVAHKGIGVSTEAQKLGREEETDEVLVKAEAGEEWDAFVEWTIEHGFFGLENLSAIPGFVGGTPIQNIGAYGVEVSDFISEVEVFDTKNLEFQILSATDCKFGYRNSIFKSDMGKDLIVTAVVFKLCLKANPKISYKDLMNYFEGSADPTPKEVRHAVIEIRKAKFPDLKIFGTAGSFFKNVICDTGIADGLKADYPELPVFDAGGGKSKISTAFVLDKICGLKGIRDGDVGLFTNQSLVVVNYGSASSKDIKSFVEKIKKIVKEKTKINLEEEVVII